GAEFSALAVEVALLLCETEPLLPGLSTRTPRFELLGAICVAPERARAPCEVPAPCVDDCTPPEPPPLWELACEVAAVFEASAVEVALFDCETLPSSPGLRTRTEMFELLGWT